MGLKKAKGDSFDEYSARIEARQHTTAAFHELSRILGSRRTFEEELIEAADSIRALTKLLRARKIQAPALLDQLRDILSRILTPSDDADIIKAADILLQRGWGRPKTETLPLDRFIGLSDKEAKEVVRASLIARAIEGDVAAQQAFLKLPTQLEILGLGDDHLDTTHLTEDDMTIFLGLVDKMRKGSTQ